VLLVPWTFDQDIAMTKHFFLSKGKNKQEKLVDFFLLDDIHPSHLSPHYGIG
jgi:hypothetical protein